MSEKKMRKTTGESLVVPEETTAPDFINNLNNDCLVWVFKYLPVHQRLIVEKVCKRWKEVAKLAWNDIKTLNFYRNPPLMNDSFKLLHIHRKTQCIGNILMRCGPHLKELTLGSSSDAKLLALVGQHCCNLTRLKLHFCSNDNNYVKELPQILRLTYLEMKNIPRRILGNFFQTLPHETLTELHLWGDGCPFRLPHKFIYALQSLLKLTALTLNGFSLKDEIKVIRYKSDLRFLSIANCTIIGQLPNFNLLTNLEHLNVACTEINNNFLIEVSENNKKLKYLNITRTCRTKGTSDHAMENLKNLCQLEELIVNNAYQISNTTVSSMHNLHKLECERCAKVNDEGIIKLMECALNLKYLNLTNSGVSEKVLEAANTIMKRRTNDLVLNVKVSPHIKRSWDIKETYSPLLKCRGKVCIL